MDRARYLFEYLRRTIDKGTARVTNEAYEAFREVVERRGMRCDNADGAENLVTEMFRYIWESNH